VTATGAGELSRRGVGTAVFAGMIASAVIGIFMIPTLYVVFQWLRERGKSLGRSRSATQTATPATSKAAPSRPAE